MAATAWLAACPGPRLARCLLLAARTLQALCLARDCASSARDIAAHPAWQQGNAPLHGK